MISPTIKCIVCFTFPVNMFSRSYMNLKKCLFITNVSKLSDFKKVVNLHVFDMGES